MLQLSESASRRAERSWQYRQLANNDGLNENEMLLSKLVKSRPRNCRQTVFLNATQNKQISVLQSNKFRGKELF